MFCRDKLYNLPKISYQSNALISNLSSKTFADSEIEKEDNLRRYGKSKEHRPNPIVRMGMFMDADGVPLAFCINPGNTSEQQTLQPLEEILANEFNLSEFVVCTDAGLGSIDNRIYNTFEGRNYIVTQSIPMLPRLMREWALEKTGWRRLGDRDDRTYDISALDPEQEKDSPITANVGSMRTEPA